MPWLLPPVHTHAPFNSNAFHCYPDVAERENFQDNYVLAYLPQIKRAGVKTVSISQVFVLYEVLINYRLFLTHVECKSASL